jgi:hypothetical protein
MSPFSPTVQMKEPSSFRNIGRRHDVVALENRACPMPADTLRHALRHASAHKISDRRTSQVVKNGSNVARLRLSFRTWTARRIQQRLPFSVGDRLEFSQTRPHTCSVPSLAEVPNLNPSRSAMEQTSGQSSCRRECCSRSILSNSRVIGISRAASFLAFDRLAEWSRLQSQLSPIEG